MNSVNNVIKIPQPFEYLLDKEFVVFDTETTGLGPTAEICEICMMDGHTGKLLLNTLVKPVNPIQEGAMRIHGITEEMVENAPTWDIISQAVRYVAQGKIGVAYNAQFDINMLIQSSNARGEIVDPLFNFDGYFCAMQEYSKRAKLYDIMRNSAKWIKLVVACEMEKIEVPSNTHRAHTDTYLTRELIAKILEEIRDENRKFA